MFFFKKKKYLKYKEFSLFSVGPKAERKRFTGFNQDTANIGVVADGNLVARHPELLHGWQAEAGSPPQAPDRPARVPVAVVAHIYYEDTWHDIAGALRGLTIPLRSDRYDSCGSGGANRVEFGAAIPGRN